MIGENDRLDRMEDILERTLVVTANNSDNTSVALARLDNIEKLTTGLAKSLTNIETRGKEIGDRVDILEKSTELTSLQCDSLNDLIKARITSLLTYGTYDYKVYFGEFSKRLRNDAHHRIGVPYRMSKVMKRDFDRYRDFIEGWIPSGGVAELKEKLMDNLNVIKNKQKYSYMVS